MSDTALLVCVVICVMAPCQAIVLHWHYSRHSTWRGLKHRYPAPSSEPTGRHHVFLNVSIRVNQHWYCPVSRLVLTSAGLMIAMRAPLLRLFHKPLLIPWDDITIGGTDSDGSLHLEVGDSTKLTLTGTAALGTNRLLDRISQRAGARGGSR